VTWPLAARAQQAAMPVIGFLQSASLDGMTELVRGFHQGLKETGYVEGGNVAVEYRFADNQLDLNIYRIAARRIDMKIAIRCTHDPDKASESCWIA